MFTMHSAFAAYTVTPFMLTYILTGCADAILVSVHTNHCTDRTLAVFPFMLTKVGANCTFTCNPVMLTFISAVCTLAFFKSVLTREGADRAFAL